MANDMGDSEEQKKGRDDKDTHEDLQSGIDEELTEQTRLKLGNALKKLVTAGVSAAFMTEESIRAYLGEVRLPKDVMNMLLSSASKSKEELMGRVEKEVINIIRKIDFVKEASRFVEEHKFRISAEIEVLKKEASETRDKSNNKTTSENE